MKNYLIYIFLIIIFLDVSYSSPLNVTLLSPDDGTIFTSSNNITFVCNATDDTNIKAISLYHDISGSFILNETSYITELSTESSSVLLMHFNNDSSVNENSTFVFDWSLKGNNGTVSGASFDSASGKYIGAFRYNKAENDYIDVQDSNSLDLTSSGSVEAWINLSSISSWMPLITKGNDDDAATAYAVWIDPTGKVRLGLTDFFYSSTTSLASGKFYHIVVTWNSTDVAFFINGSLDSTEAVDLAAPENSKVLRIGGNSVQNFWFDGVIDELAIYNRQLASNEVADHFSRNLTNETSQNFTVGNAPDGTYVWNCLAENYDSEKNFSSNFTVFLDASSPPLINTITINPNSTQDLDPNMVVNVTANVTDPSGVDTVILQWKETGDWNNITMDYDNESSIYVNGTITIDITGGLYFYRVFANDSNGRSGFSTTRNLTASFDYTWTLNPSNFGTVSGAINTLNNITNITINNTGDDTLEFSITDDWPFSVFYNGSENPSYIVPAKNVLEIEVNATFESSDNERNITITVSASHSSETPVPSSDTVKGTLNSFGGGPFLDVTIITIPASVSQSDTGVNLTATVKNIGNETAQNVTFNWSLPSGWSNTSGQINMLIGNITPQETNTSSLIITVSSSTNAKIYSVCANSTGFNTSDEECRNVQVVCSDTDNVCGTGCTFNNDDNCPVPSSDGGGGGSGSGGGEVGGGKTTVVSPSIKLTAPLRTDIFRGDSKKISAEVKNTAENTVVKNISLIVSGYSKTLVTITPLIINNLDFGAAKKFEIEIKSPNYVKYGPYNITLRVVGTAVIDRSDPITVEDTATLKLLVQSATENETLDLFKKSKSYLTEMINLGFNVSRIAGMLVESENALSNFDYDRSKEISEEIIKIKEKVFRIFGTMQGIKNDIDTALNFDIDVPETQKLYSAALAAFNRGDYDRAEERMSSAIIAKNVEMGNKIVTAKLLKDYWWLLLIISFGAMLGIVFVHRLFLANSIKSRVNKLRKEEKAIKDIVKNLQSSYFEKRKISKKEYEETMIHHRKRQAKLKREIISLETKKINLFGLKVVSDDYHTQKNIILKIIADTQKKHFESESMGKKEYEDTMHELKDELAEIEKKLEKKIKKINIFLILIIISVLFNGLSYAQSDNLTAASDAIKLAESNIMEMQSLGFGINRANDTLAEAKILFGQKNYLGSELIAMRIGKIKESAVNSNSLIDESDLKIIDAELKGLEISYAKELFSSGLEAFQAERFEESENLFIQSIHAVDEIESKKNLEKALEKNRQNNIVNFVQNNWHMILFLTALSSFILVIFYKLTKPFRTRRKIKFLESEKEALENSIKKLQKKYFEDYKISKNDYEHFLHNYQKKLLETKKEIKILSRKK